MDAGRSAGAQARRKREKAAGLRASAADLVRRAEQLERAAENWDKGEQGERVVGAQLDALVQHGWIVMHDVRWPGRPRANIDHVAIGPGGILVVDAKNWSGAITVRDGQLSQNRRSRNRDLHGVSEAGRAVGGLLALPWNLHVMPVLCTSEPLQVPPQQCGEVTVLSATDMVSWATGLAAPLTPGDVLGLARQLEASLTSADAPRLPTAGGAVGRRPAPAYGHAAHVSRRRPRRRVTRARPRRAEFRLLLVKVAVLGALALAAPTIVLWWQDVAGGVVADVVDAPTVVPSVSAPAVFDSCRALRAVHPTGVKALGAQNVGTKIVHVGTHDPVLAAANKDLDRDGDGILCEVSRKHADSKD